MTYEEGDDMQSHPFLHPNFVPERDRPDPPGLSTWSCSAVKDVLALLAGFGWLSCSEGTAPSKVMPFPARGGEKVTLASTPWRGARWPSNLGEVWSTAFSLDQVLGKPWSRFHELVGGHFFLPP